MSEDDKPSNKDLYGKASVLKGRLLFILDKAGDQYCTPEALNKRLQRQATGSNIRASLKTMFNKNLLDQHEKAYKINNKGRECLQTVYLKDSSYDEHFAFLR